VYLGHETNKAPLKVVLGKQLICAVYQEICQIKQHSTQVKCEIVIYLLLLKLMYVIKDVTHENFI